MDRLKLVLIAGALLWAAPAARAQGAAVGVGVDPSLMAGAGKKPKDRPMRPLALAMSLVFDATTWAGVGVSTAAPARDLTAFLDGGYYRLELLQLTLMAKASGKKLSDLTKLREKKKTLREIALELSQNYDGVYDESLRFAEEVDAGVAAVSRIRPVERSP